MSTSPPAVLGKYQIIREIARSNDIVYEGYDPSMNRRVAIKELAMPAGASTQQREERIRRFQREIKAAGSLSHPNIVTIYEFGQDGDRYFMAMEYLDGRTLRNEIDTTGVLSKDRAIEIATDVLCALDFAHSHGVIHRDVKPENVQLLENGQVKLTDFGIARLTFEPNITMDGQVFGTPSYMSPEQVVGKNIDARSDLFSVATILYEMLTGVKPFTGDSVVTITYAIMNNSIPHPPQVDFELWKVIDRGLEKSPDLRIANAKQFIEALATAMQPRQAFDPPAYGAPSYASNQMVNPYAPPQIAPSHYPPAPPYSQPYQQPYSAPYSQPYPGTYQQPYQPQYQTPYQPPQQQYPVYYPPPPMPLVSTETKLFFKRLFVTILVVGGFIALVIFMVNTLAGALQEQDKMNRDSKLRTELNKSTAGVPVDKRIDLRKNAIPNIESKVGKEEENTGLANDYLTKAHDLERKGDLYTAEENYDNAVQTLPNNATVLAEKAAFYERTYAAKSGQLNGEMTEQLLTSCADTFKSASEKSEDGATKQDYANRSAVALLKLGDYFRDQDRIKARDFYSKAREIAVPGTATYAQANDKLNSMR